jgi:hypothetical protein
MENVLDRLRFLSATRSDISTELEFIASHFYDFLRRRDALNALPFSMIYTMGILLDGCNGRLFGTTFRAFLRNQCISVGEPLRPTCSSQQEQENEKAVPSVDEEREAAR